MYSDCVSGQTSKQNSPQSFCNMLEASVTPNGIKKSIINISVKRKNHGTFKYSYFSFQIRISCKIFGEISEFSTDF